jgi:ABC-type molybdate transport system substrate-binding protein
MRWRFPLAAWAACGLAFGALPSPGWAQAAAATVRVHAAGSLRAALQDVAAAFKAQRPGVAVQLEFGASGLLATRLLVGEATDVFASANMAHPEMLASAGLALPVQRFARNAMCVLARTGLVVKPETVVQHVLDPTLKLGVSTPRADPAGDYAVQVFDNLEKAGHAGALAALKARALQLTGGPNSPPPPVDRNVYGVLVAQGAADLFITYCTNGLQAVREQPGQTSTPLPEAINVSASYGVVRMKSAPAEAEAFVDFLLAPAGQALLARHGFSPR